MTQQQQAYLYAGLAVACWSTVASAFKITLRYLSVLEMLFLASLTSAAVLFAILCLQGKVRALLTGRRQDTLRSLGLGVGNPFVYYLILFQAYDLLPAQEAQPLNYLWPLMVVLLSALLLRQRISPAQGLAILVSFLGVLVISTRGDVLSFRFTHAPGAALAVSSSVVWALFWILNMKDKRDAVVKLFLCSLSGSLCAALAVLLTGGLRPLPLGGVLGALYIGLFEMGVTFVLWLKALSLSRNTALVSNFVYLSPFLSLAVIRCTVGETILPSSVIGLGFIMAGVILQGWVGRRKS